MNEAKVLPFEHVVEKAAKPKMGRVVQDQTIWMQLTRSAGALTPAAVSARLAEADIGRMGPLVDLWNALRQKDGHLQGIAETRETAVQRLDWELELPKKPTKREKKAAQFVDDAIRTSLAPLIAHCSSSPFTGYAVTETVIRRSSGYLVPDRFKPIAPRRFIYSGETLLWQDQPGLIDGVDLRREYPGQFVISQPRVNGDVPCREGLMRVLVWAALFRNWTLTDWLRLGEIAWRPWRVGKYDRQAFALQEDVDGLVAVLDGMSTSGTAVIPNTVELDVKFPEGGGKGPHGELFATLGREMSKSVLGQTETTESSASSGYAQSKTHQEVRKDKTEADASFIASDITRDLITPLILWNFGAGIRIPSMRFLTEDAVDLESFGKSVGSMSKAGLRMPAKWARDKAGIPHPIDGEEIIGGPTDEAAQDPTQKPPGPDTKPEDAPKE
jgi:phage gp29-like protein